MFAHAGGVFIWIAALKRSGEAILGIFYFRQQSGRNFAFLYSSGIGAVLGAIGGTMNEALTKHGVSEEDATYYGDRMKDGAVVVTVEDAGIDDDRVRDVLYRNGGHNSGQVKTAVV